MNPVYIIFLIMFLIAGSIYEIMTGRDSKAVALISLLLFALAIMQRSTSTPDTENYIEAYKEIDFANLKYDDFNLGFTYLICIVKMFRFKEKHFFALLAMINFIINYGVCRTVFYDYTKSKKNLETGVSYINLEEKNICFKSCIFSALWIPYFGMFYSGTVLRAGVALSLVSLSGIYIYKNRYIAGGVIIAIAMLFHTSAILGIMLFLPVKMKIKTQENYFWLWIGIVIVWISHIGILLMKLIPAILHWLYKVTNIGSFAKYEMFYAGSIRSTGFFGKKELFFLVIGIILITLGWSRSKTYHTYMSIFYFGILLSFVIEYIMNSYRIVDFFLMFIVPCGCIYFMDRHNKIKRRWNALIIAVMTVFQFVISMNIIGFS